MVRWVEVQRDLTKAAGYEATKAVMDGWVCATETNARLSHEDIL